VFNSSEKDPQQLDPATIDWASITKDNFTYLFRQQPGPDNGLGVVKFIFPNEFGIYLHDTPHRELFRETTREFSSGCIRVEKSIELALYLLQDNPGWDRDKIDRTVASGTGIKVDLARRVAVHLLYWTAWVDPGNTIHFANDIYQRDKILAKALSQVP
jgi:murein L,D-transpeptidase YcbB/YkuD